MSLFYLNTPLRYGDSDESSWPFGALTTGGQRGQTTGRGQQSQASRAVLPKMDWIEQDNKNIVLFELPGLKKRDVDISLHDNLLTVSGVVKPGFEVSKDHVHLVNERRLSNFSRSLTVPAGLQQDEVKATMDCGVLHIEFPKHAKGGATKKITIAEDE